MKKKLEEKVLSVQIARLVFRLVKEFPYSGAAGMIDIEKCQQYFVYNIDTSIGRLNF